MAEAKATIPAYSATVEVDGAPILALRAELAATRPDLAPPSVNDLIVKAVAIALRAHPTVNGTYKDGKWERYPRVNIGIAVDAETTLAVPVIHDADQLSVGQIAARTRELADKARSGQLRPPDVSSATFTVSNLGMLGVDEFTAVISPGQAAILTVGRIADWAVVRDGAVVVFDESWRPLAEELAGDMPRARADVNALLGVTGRRAPVMLGREIRAPPPTPASSAPRRTSGGTGRLPWQ